MDEFERGSGIAEDINMDPEAQELKNRWLREFAQFETIRGKNRASDFQESLRLSAWWIEMYRAGIIITELEMIEAGINPWGE